MNNNNVKLIVINFPLIRPIVDGPEQAHFEGAPRGDLGEFLPLGSLGTNWTMLPTICLGKIKAHDLVQPSSLEVPQLALIPLDEESRHAE